MSIQLPVVRYYTPADPYNYVVDNRPIYDLANGLNVLKSAVDNMASSGNGVNRATSAGPWPMSFNLDLSSKRSSNWCIKASIWAIENSNNMANYSVIEVVLAGTNNDIGLVNLINATTLSTVKVGSGDIYITYNTSIIDRVQFNLSGYTSSYGYISVAYTIL